MKNLFDLVYAMRDAPLSEHRRLIREFWLQNKDAFWRARGRYRQQDLATMLNIPQPPLSRLEKAGTLPILPARCLAVITLYASLSKLEPTQESKMRTLFDNPFDIVKYVRIADGTYRIFHKHADMAAQTRDDEIVEAAGFIVYGSPAGSDKRVFAIPTRLLVLSPPAQPAIDGPALARQIDMLYDPAGV